MSIAMSIMTAITMLTCTDLRAEPEPGFVTVSGTAAYLQRIAMPPDAVLTVRIEDVSRMDIVAPVIAESTEAFGGRQVPIAFELKVPGSAVDPQSSYALRASISVGGELRFTTTARYPVLTRGAPDKVDLRLDAVHARPADSAASGAAIAPEHTGSTAQLKDTYWKLIEIDGEKLVMAEGQRREVRITLANQDSRVIGFSGCNQLMGSYEQDGNNLRFKQMAGTMMACMPPLMELERKVLEVIGATTGYRIDGEQLTLLADDKELARFESVYLR